MDVRVEFAWEKGKRGRPAGPDYEAASRGPLSHASVYGELVVRVLDRHERFDIEAASADECLDSAFLSLLEAFKACRSSKGTVPCDALTLLIAEDELLLGSDTCAWTKPDGSIRPIAERRTFRLQPERFAEALIGAARRFLQEVEAAAGPHGRNVMAAFRSALDSFEQDPGTFGSRTWT